MAGDIQRLPTLRGVAWLTGGLMLIRRQPARLLLFGLILQFLMGLAQSGLLGLILILSIPALTAGMLHVMSAVDRGLRPPLTALFAAFTSGPRLLRLLALGALVLALAIIAVMIGLAGAPLVLDEALITRLEQGDVSAVQELDPALRQRMVLAVLAGMLLGGCVSYFAVPLVWFADRAAAAAMLAGVMGLLRNWRPMLLLGFLLLVIAMPAGLLTGVLLVAPAGESAMSPLLALVTLLLVVIFQLLVFGTQYAAFKDIFGLPPAAGDEGARADDQLVA
ncbi:MAG: hypothetical protein GTN86_12025 [Xanthomonadales bacterium]|nr:hypothetical protein [Xanthomonadales bacterium]NIN60442.1 hypothetical protein [Xanthomonadales bacterium]NIN75795.1 hypothetical protein [Xanthomonadales bacterium]NIO12973.1 hypothetical protein [Xanthomonadales bacterium]NIP12835.1 hypothetical protein [Xanthomonadales bacterium]